MEVFRVDALKRHNQLREMHGAGALRSAQDLERSAQQWADKLIKMAKLENSQLSRRGEVGESISLRSSTAKEISITGEEVSNQWYKDIEKYDYEKGVGQGGNFTQLVWLGTREVGFARAQADGKVIVVAHYRPPGNVRGRYNDNVKPPKTPGEAAAAADGARGSTSNPELEGYRVRSRQIDTDERVIDGEKYIVEIETIDYENSMGEKKQKIVERTRKRVDSSSDEESGPSGSKTHGEDTEKFQDLKISDKQLKKFIKETITHHNHKRKLHNAKPLKKNKELNALAQAFADELSQKTELFNSSCKYKGDRLGENIASRWSNGPTDYTGEQVTNHWYEEHLKYDFSQEPSNVKGVGNFTQLVWRNTKEIGVGKAIHKDKNGSYKVVVVCFYHPAGNVLQCFQDNVEVASGKH